jgi:hypothetical protein
VPATTTQKEEAAKSAVTPADITRVRVGVVGLRWFALVRCFSLNN